MVKYDDIPISDNLDNTMAAGEVATLSARGGDLWMCKWA